MFLCKPFTVVEPKKLFVEKTKTKKDSQERFLFIENISSIFQIQFKNSSTNSEVVVEGWQLNYKMTQALGSHTFMNNITS